MRLYGAIVLTLPPALLPGVYAAAANPTTSFVQEYRPLATAGPYAPVWDLRSQWRSLSGRVIETIWGSKPCHEGPAQEKRKKTDSRKALDEQRPPTHTLAQYGGDVVLRFNLSTAEEVTSFADAADTLLLDVWEFTEDWVDVRLAMELVPSLLGLLPETLRHAHKPLLKERDLAQAIFETYPAPKEEGESRSTEQQQPQQRPFGPMLQPNGPHRATGAETNIFFTDYQPLSVIMPWLRLMSSLFTTHVRPITIGLSAENRPITGLRIGVHPTNNEAKPPPDRKTVLITAGLHAREWISTSTALYIAYNLITGYGKSPGTTKLLEDFDFVIVPTLNPDGYTYTWTTDRLWRKTRQNTPVSFCPGIDLDHAFGFAWSGASSGGNPCSEAYAGTTAFGATEAEALATWARNETQENNVEFVGFLDLHSYSQQILYPYSYSCRPSPPGLEDLEELGYGLMKAIRLAHGHGYEVLPACEGNTAFASSKQGKREILPAVEARGGSALDWFYHELKVRWAYQIKLRDRGMYGFLLPKEHIVPTGKEILEAVMYFGGYLQEVYVAGKEPGQKPDVGKEDVVQSLSGEEVTDAVQTVEEDEEAWVLVEDLGVEPKWDLKRRRRR